LAPVGTRGTRLPETRLRLAERLRSRQPEIERAVLTRVHAIAESAGGDDPAYSDGLRSAVSAALDYGLAALDANADRVPPVPVSLLAQARLAARNKVSLDTVLRRYFAGYALLGDFLVEEAERDSIDDHELRPLLRTQAAVLDRLLKAVGEEYARDAEKSLGNAEQRRAERVKKLLDGEPFDAGELEWDFEAFQVAVVASDAAASQVLRSCAATRERRLLLVHGDGDTLWAWLGAGQPSELGGLAGSLRASRPIGCALGVGEPAQGLAGWRLSHRQAAAALTIARRGSERVVRYAEAAVLASALRDSLLTTSLQQLYLGPLEAERDGGRAARETLRAYFGTERNISSTAAVLGVNRHTVAGRLRAIEERLGSSLDACGADLEVALKLEDLSGPALSAVDDPAW
jgi:PucR C-terminal helix-turn-helix domain/GGDEF-like domain